MPVSKSRKHSPPINTGKKPQQINGFYVHSSPRKVLQVHSNTIREWLRNGDLNQLEQFVLEGQGYKLVGEYSSDPKVRSFLKQIPTFLIKTKKLQDAITKGDLKKLQKLLLNIKFHESPLKNIHMTKNQGGLGLLHKAVYYGHPQIVEFLVSNFPQSIKMKDNDGKTPLHYCGASKEAGKIWPILIKAGANAAIKDSKGKLPAYYMERANEIQLPEEKILNGINVSSTQDRNNLIIKPSNLRIWIHDRDIKKLQQVIWEGHGAKLRVETSKHPKVKRFLEGVPYILNIIKDVHSSVIKDNLEEFLKKTASPIPADILGSKDINGLTPLHKAAGLNRKKIAENILQRRSSLALSVDQEGKTPLHYAATLKDRSEMYNLLTRNFADETAMDKYGKTASYYKTNPKEIAVKILEVIPEAPRTSAIFPQLFDWSLFHPEDLKLANSSSSIKNSPSKKVEENHYRDIVVKSNLESEWEPRETYQENLEFKPSESEEKSPVADIKNSNASEDQMNQDTKETEDIKTFDIWTNDDNEDVYKRESYSSYDEEDNVQEYEGSVRTKREKERESDSDEKKDAWEDTKELAGHSAFDNAGSFEERDTRQKTDREIAEERQRLLDEGLLKIRTENDNNDNEEAKLRKTIEVGDMETLASMVLNGEGYKLQGRISNDPEVQSFLDNVPIYMVIISKPVQIVQNKIKALHEAARNGSLKTLQTALDRRKFAVAKDSSDKSGATLLHSAVIFENTPIIKYLVERFPETLTSKDNFGRTPLHYAAVLRDGGLIYNALLDLGANPNIKDNEGHTPIFYQNDSGKLIREKLLEEMNLPDRVNDEQVNDQGVSSPMTDPSIHDVEPEISFDEGSLLSKSKGNRDGEEDNNESNSSQSNFNLTDRDEYGQSVLHFAAARAHGRGGLFQLIHESGVNLGYRDELYRTARDIAQQANIPDNINEIDKYVISLAAKGETGKLVELFLEGYDHILDLEDDEDKDIMTIVSNKGYDKTLAFLKAIPVLEQKREKIHRAIRTGDCGLIEMITLKSKNVRFLITGKNTSGRCSLHIAILCQQKQIAEFISQKFPEALKIGDNLERTPLHYAMGVEEVETLSRILIQCGAKRVIKDLKGRQPTYYFMNKTEILKLQEEENALKLGNNLATT